MSRDSHLCMHQMYTHLIKPYKCKKVRILSVGGRLCSDGPHGRGPGVDDKVLYFDRGGGSSLYPASTYFLTCASM